MDRKRFSKDTLLELQWAQGEEEQATDLSSVLQRGRGPKTRQRFKSSQG